MRTLSGRLVVLLAAAGLSACAARGAAPRPFPEPASGEAGRGGAPPPASGVPLLPAVAALLTTAHGLAGLPYRNGGSGPDAFDCSGYVQYVFARHGIPLPRTVAHLAEAGVPVDTPQPGDLLFFATSGDGPTHVGIALGDDRFIHAPSSRGVVRVERLSAPYWSRRYLLARRVM